MGNTTSMKAPHEHKHGDVTCTMKHGRKSRHNRTAKRSGHKRHGKKHRLYSGSSLMVPISPKKKNHKRYYGGVMMSPPA